MGATVFESLPPTDHTIEESLRETRHSCFWLDDVADRMPRFARLAGDTRADDVVVGGGFAGLWTAIKLKTEHPERRILLLEGRRMGWAASGRNGGFCEASLSHGEANAQARWPDEVGVLRRLGMQNLDAIEQFVTEHQLDVDFERSGALSVANELHQLAWLGESGDSEVQVLDADAVRKRIHSPIFLGGEFTARENALVHPAKLVAELARHAASIGVEMHEESPVRSLSRLGEGPILLQLHHGNVVAERVAVCTNAFPSIVKRFAFHTVPVYDYVLMTEPLTDEQLRSIGWEGREGLADMANQFHYSRLTSDNRILWGGYDAVYRSGGRIRAGYEDRPESYRRLASHFFTTFPQLAGVRFSHRWAGVIDTSTRFCAFFGEAYGGRVQVVAGFTGLGVAATHFAADVVADRFAGRVTERTELQMVRQMPVPFPPEPLAALGIGLTRWALDRADHREGKRNLFLRALDAVGLGFDS